MIYALDKIAPGTANEDTLLYGVEVKFYNMKVDVDRDLGTGISGLYAIGDGSGVTHSLSQASASGVYVARKLNEKNIRDFKGFYQIHEEETDMSEHYKFFQNKECEYFSLPQGSKIQKTLTACSVTARCTRWAISAEAILNI